jgi:thiamine pyrophosphate-dependent acetolactate synthase large subunit-like protein
MTQAKLDRRAVVAVLLKGRRDVAVIAGLGASAYDLAAPGDHDHNFYLWGAMGGAAMMGLGLALAKPDLPVLVVTGDGEALMGLGAFASIGLHDPKNLTIVILDNEAYAETGGQATHTARTTDLAAVARACGIKDARMLASMADVESFVPRVHAAGQGTTVAVVKIEAAEPAKVLPPRDGVFLMTRMRAALGTPAN